jgi:hypothetical protein
VLGVLGGVAGTARAQSSGPGTIEIAAGPVVTSRVTLSSADATETTPTGGSFTLFTTSTTLARSTGVDVHLGVRLTPHLEAIGGLTYGTPRLRIAASGDAENAASVTASERLQQAVITGGLLVYLRSFTAESRIVPFVSAEAGYDRVLHEERTFLQQSRAYIVGGGVKYVIHRGGGIKRIGVRADARAVAQSRGLFDQTRVSPSAGASLFMRF